MPPLFEKLRLPLGSLIVDGALVTFLAYTAGQMTTRFEAMDMRVAHVEKMISEEKLSQRTAILEQRVSLYDRDREEIIESLLRIESKLDGKADRALR